MAKKSACVVPEVKPHVLECIPFQEAWLSITRWFTYYKERHEKALKEFIERVSKSSVDAFSWRGQDIIAAETEMTLVTEIIAYLSYAAAVQNVSNMPGLRPITDFPHAKPLYQPMEYSTIELCREARFNELAKEMVRKLDEWKEEKLRRALDHVASNNASTSEFGNLANRCNDATTVRFLTGTFSVPFKGFRDTLEQVYVPK